MHFEAVPLCCTDKELSNAVTEYRGKIRTEILLEKTTHRTGRMSELGILVQAQHHLQQEDHATGHKHACDKCSFSTSHLPALRTHVAVQHKEKDQLKPLACKFCGYRTSYRGNLKKHVRIHTGEKPFSCQYCGKRFASKSNHKTHETTHTRHKFTKCPVPQCFYMCSRLELDKHIAQEHSGLDLTLSSTAKLNELKERTLKKVIKQEQLPAPQDLSKSCKMKDVVSSTMASDLPTMVPRIPAGLTLFEREALALPSNTLVWSMQESLIKRETVFPTYGQQPVFPGGVVFPEQIAPEEKGMEAENDPNLGSSESESCSESADSKRPAELEAEAELMRQGYSESSEGSEKDFPGVPADSTSGKAAAELQQTTVQDMTVDTPSKTAPSAVISPSVRTPEKVLKGGVSPDCGAITKALFERKLLHQKSGGWAHVANVVNSLVQSDADADAVVNTLVDQGHLFHCIHCNIFFPEYSTYVLHRSCHDHVQPFQCHYCQESFPEKFGFLTHFMQCAKKGA